jgi:hypothetical protein
MSSVRCCTIAKTALLQRDSVPFQIFSIAFRTTALAGVMQPSALHHLTSSTMQVARTSQRCMRSSALPRCFSSCAVSSKAAASSSTASTSENSQQFTTRPRFFDSLSKRSSPKARHYDMGENSSLRLTIRPPSSPAPFSQPAVTSTPSSSAIISDSQLPPALHKAPSEYATLTSEQISEMQALRLSDPATWTRSKLAAKYNVSKFFVAMTSFGDSHEAKETAKTVKETHDMNSQREREGWGFKKRVDREVRRRRKEFW